MPDDYIVAGTDFGYTDSYTISTSDTYSNCISGTSTFSEANLCALEELCKEFIDDNGNKIVPYSNYLWYLPTPLPPPPHHMPKFKKGDVIEYDSCWSFSTDRWRFEKGERFYVLGADHDTYWLSVVLSSDGCQKEFSVLASKIDYNCKYASPLDFNSKPRSNSYFPNLSHV